MNQTYDNKKITRHYGLEDVDKAFLSWFQDKLRVTLTDGKGNQKEVPVFFFSAERWSKSREDTFDKKGAARDKDGTLILPIITIIRPSPTMENDGPYARIFAENKEEYTFYTQVSQKSSLIKNLAAARKVNPTAPIYEIYTAPVPDHYQLTYEIKIWTQYVEDMNEIIQKIGQQLDYKSERSFQFSTPDGYYFIAFQDTSFEDESNLEEYSNSERIIRMSTTFTVPAHIIPESNQRKSKFKRYLSQTKLSVKFETVMNMDEFDEKYGEK